MTELALDVKQAVTLAQVAAKLATNEWMAKNGNVDCCGFAWVTTYEVKGSTRLGRALKEAGFSKSHDGGLQLWNPSRSMTQSMGALEAGAEAAAKVLTEQLGVKFYMGSRMD